MPINNTSNTHQFNHLKKHITQLVTSLMVGMAVPAFSNMALAEAATPTDFKKIYKIDAGPLGIALTSFASQSGVVLSFNPTFTEGKSTAGLNGSFAIDEGFSLLLKNTDLAVSGNPQQGYIIQKVATNASQPTDTLPEIVVVDQADSGQSSENDNTKYLQRKATSTSRIPLTIKESPMTVTVISKKLIDDVAARDISDAVKTIASVTLDNKNAGRQPALRSRGFLLDDVSAYLIDGQPMYGLLDQPIELVESLEVLRGPAGVQYGRGRGNGVINLIRKKPTQESLLSLKTSAGSWDYKQIQLDAGGRVPDYEHLGYRVNISTERSNSFRDNVFLDKDVIGLAFDAVINDDLKLTLLADYVNRDTPWDAGQFFYRGRPNDVPRGRFYEIPWGSISTSNTTLGYQVDWKLNENWAFKHQFTFQDYHVDRHISSKSNPNAITGNFNLTETRGVTDGKVDSFIFDLIGDNMLLGMRHRSVVGFHRVNIDLETRSQTASNIYTSNIFRPANLVRRPLPLSPFESTNNSTFTGIYAEDYIGILPKLNLMLGARYDEFDEKTASAALNPVVDSRKNNAVTPRVGLVFTPIDPVTIYASYMRGFEPGGRAASAGTFIPSNLGELFDPQESEQYEVGLKTNFLDDRLAFNLAVYDLTRKNIPFNDLSTNQVTLIGEQRNKGFEIELIGDITPNWSVMSSYAYLDGEVVDGANKGNKPNLAPRHSSRLWSAYTFNSGNLKNLSVYGGVFNQGDVFGDTANTFELKGFTRFDAGASYKHLLGSQVAIWRFNLDNITDKKYYMGNSTTGLLPATPRNARLSLEVLF